MTRLADDTRRRLERFVYDVMAEESLPGVSVAVVDGDGLAYAEGFGSRDLSENLPATADTLYGFGSVTKSFTALALATLAEEGHLDFDDPVADHVPFEVETDGTVTLHHLLTHSSGLPSLGVSKALIARRTGSGEAGVPLGDRDDVHAFLAGADDEVVAPPGERFAYCNTGYVLLGEVIARYAGTDYASYVEDAILDPLGMDRSTFDGDAFAADADGMTPYFHDGGDLSAAPLPERPVTYPTGGLLTSVVEVADYLRLHLGGGEVDGVRLASEAAVERMHAGHVDTPEGPYGYGWRRRDVAGTTVVGHGGSIGVSSAYVGVVPAEDLGVAVACNTSPAFGLAEVGQGVVAALTGTDPAALPFFDRRARFEAYVGEYETYRGVLSARVSRDGEFLRLDVEGARGESGTPLVPVDGTGEGGEFYALTPGGERSEVRFARDGDDLSLLYDRRRFHRVC
ncbi:MAG: serine hydrolase [Haloferacaceae archaeon]